jgi:MtrB/PioB family decaheme-associated outer membrane protein
MRAAVLRILVLLAVAAPAPAQTAPVQTPATQPPQPVNQPPVSPPQTTDVAEPVAARGWTGRLDFGVRGTSVDGDAARYERYRDLGDGLFLEGVRLSGAQRGWLMNFQAEHVARRDQRYIAAFGRPGKLKGQFVWDQIPMLLSNSTRTLFGGIGSSTLTIDDAIQAQGQAAPASLVELFGQFGRTFETRTRRHIAQGSVEYEATPNLTFRTSIRRTSREGTIPYGGSFGHSSLVELPAPTNHTLGDVDADAEYVRDPLLLRAGYSGSWFHNDVTALAFDNPFRLTDIASASSRGRLSLAPSHSFIGVNGLASVKLPRRSRVTAHVSVGTLKDAGDPLMPQTINTAVTPAALQRGTVEGEARTSSVMLSFVSRPTRLLDFSARYRTYDYDNRTPEFAMSQRIAYDNAPSAVSPPVETEPFGVLRHTFDADMRVTPAPRVSAGIGFTRVGEERTHRIFESTADTVVRLTFDALSRRWFGVRTKYEHASRRGEGIEQGILELQAIGEQPGMRHFDIASRDRDRVTIIASVTPHDAWIASLTFAAGKDDYLQSTFGLRDNTHQVYGAGLDYAPGDRVTLGLSYTYEEYAALSRSRQANPGAEFTDPSRNWAVDSADRTHSVLLNADIRRIVEKLDVHASYDFSRGRARYDYITGPVANRTLPEEVIVPTTLPTPSELPPTLNELQRATLDGVYRLTPRIGFGVSWWHERYRVNDFTLDIDANPSLVRGQALLMGYLYRPYTANTVWGRLIYSW